MQTIKENTTKFTKWHTKGNYFILNYLGVVLVRKKLRAYTYLTSSNQHMLNSLSNIQEPTSYAQAAHHPGWQEVMAKEIEAFEFSKTWDVVKLPQDCKALPCKWVYKVKQHSDGSIERLKARLVL